MSWHGFAATHELVSDGTTVPAGRNVGAKTKKSATIGASTHSYAHKAWPQCVGNITIPQTGKRLLHSSDAHITQSLNSGACGEPKKRKGVKKGVGPQLNQTPKDRYTRKSSNRKQPKR